MVHRPDLHIQLAHRVRRSPDKIFGKIYIKIAVRVIPNQRKSNNFDKKKTLPIFKYFPECRPVETLEHVVSISRGCPVPKSPSKDVGKRAVSGAHVGKPEKFASEVSAILEPQVTFHIVQQATSRFLRLRSEGAN